MFCGSAQLQAYVEYLACRADCGARATSGPQLLPCTSVVLCQLFGPMSDLQPEIPAFTCDLMQEASRISTVLPAQQPRYTTRSATPGTTCLSPPPSASSAGDPHDREGGCIRSTRKLYRRYIGQADTDVRGVVHDPLAVDHPPVGIGHAPKVPARPSRIHERASRDNYGATDPSDTSRSPQYHLEEQMWEQIGRSHAFHSEVAPEVRILKLAEETSEAAALIGMNGWNLRKGTCATRDEVLDELADVIITAAVAMAGIAPCWVPELGRES